MLPSPMRALGRVAKDNSPDELHIAVLTGRMKKIKSLLKKGVHIESVNTLGQTPLFCAAYGGDHEVVELLLRLGANPNRKCGSGGTSPVHAAAYRGSRRVLRLLVEVGGDLSLRDNEFLTARDYAQKQPSPLRRQKITEFLDLLFNMTLHRTHCARLSTSTTCPSVALPEFHKQSSTATLGRLQQNKFFGSQMSLSRKSSLSSINLWGSCVATETGSPVHPAPSIPEGKEFVPTQNLHKSVSCHLLDQLCVTTSLPLLSPTQLQRPLSQTPAYTCGGPTVYSPFSWIGTPVTVRRPTPALSLHRQSDEPDLSSFGEPDQDAVNSLLQELAFLRRLRHPGFLEVMAACHVTHPSPDHVTLVFQSVPYGSLYHHLHEQHRDLAVGSAVDILVNLVEALLFMHAHGWFHCGLSSHVIHLVSMGAAKLGGFEYAIESQAKGCGMRAEHLTRATWLKPWQPPETIGEKMVSVKSEVYSVSAIIWEIWAGMPPWAGFEDDEAGKRVENGETLPKLSSSSVPSLISYVTEYGLKWNAHERELDLQEIHTMLRSLRVQCHEEERVPAVTSWGPPSIPNTPVIGRHKKLSASTSEGSQSDLRKGKGWEEVVGIKPASHQLTRHSSSCSLASGPSSPAHKGSNATHSFLAAAERSKIAGSHKSVPSSPLPAYLRSQTLPPRPSDSTNKTEEGQSRNTSRRHSEILRQRPRRYRRRQELEVEEEFIDDEFNALLFDQPHMQLSVGSSENLLESRLSGNSLLGDDSECSSVSGGPLSHRMTSSEDDEDDFRKSKCVPLAPPSFGGRSINGRRALKALEETGDSDNEEEVEKKEALVEDHKVGGDVPFERLDPTIELSASYVKAPKRSISPKRSNSPGSEIDYTDDDVFAIPHHKSNKTKDSKDLESLNSYKILKNLKKNLTTYLPTYSIGSDTDSG